MTDTAVETKVFSESPLGSESRWGFGIERLKRNRPIIARELRTMTRVSHLGRN